LYLIKGEKLPSIFQPFLRIHTQHSVYKYETPLASKYLICLHYTSFCEKCVSRRKKRSRLYKCINSHSSDMHTTYTYYIHTYVYYRASMEFFIGPTLLTTPQDFYEERFELEKVTRKTLKKERGRESYIIIRCAVLLHSLIYISAGISLMNSSQIKIQPTSELLLEF